MNGEEIWINEKGIQQRKEFLPLIKNLLSMIVVKNKKWKRNIHQNILEEEEKLFFDTELFFRLLKL